MLSRGLPSALAPVAGSALQAVYILEAGLYFCYVGNMVSVTYFSFIKPTFKVTFKASVCLGLLALAEAIVFGALVQYGAFEPTPTLTPAKKLFGIF